MFESDNNHSYWRYNIFIYLKQCPIITANIKALYLCDLRMDYYWQIKWKGKSMAIFLSMEMSWIDYASINSLFICSILCLRLQFLTLISEYAGGWLFVIRPGIVIINKWHLMRINNIFFYAHRTNNFILFNSHLLGFFFLNSITRFILWLILFNFQYKQETSLVDYLIIYIMFEYFRTHKFKFLLSKY